MHIWELFCVQFSTNPLTEGVDYERLFLTYFELGQGERFCRMITIINDEVVEGREFFVVVLEDLRWGEILDTLAVVIEDEDCKWLELKEILYSVKLW